MDNGLLLLVLAISCTTCNCFITRLPKIHSEQKSQILSPGRRDKSAKYSIQPGFVFARWPNPIQFIRRLLFGKPKRLLLERREPKKRGWFQRESEVRMEPYPEPPPSIAKQLSDFPSDKERQANRRRRLALMRKIIVQNERNRIAKQQKMVHELEERERIRLQYRAESRKNNIEKQYRWAKDMEANLREKIEQKYEEEKAEQQVEEMNAINFRLRKHQENIRIQMEQNELEGKLGHVYEAENDNQLNQSENQGKHTYATNGVSKWPPREYFDGINSEDEPLKDTIAEKNLHQFEVPSKDNNV